LGVQLIDRTTKSFKVSEYGQLLLPYAREIVNLQNQYNAALQKKIPSEREILTIGTLRSMAQYNIIDILASFKKTRPQSTVKVIHSTYEGTPIDGQKLKDILRQKKCDLAFIRIYEEGDEDLVKIPYLSDHLIAVFPAGHPMANSNSIPLTSLKDFGLLLLEEGSYLYKRSIRLCKESGFDAKVVHTDAKPENIIEFVIQEMGVALIMKQLAVYLANPQIKIVDITPTVESEVCLCYLKNSELSEAAKQLVVCMEIQKKKNASLLTY
jgi:LysR family transcriptional regulator, transcription activator of glutamate synthase operon